LQVNLEDAWRMTGFSEIANRVLNGAVEEAACSGHATVGVEHLLLVLCRDRRNVAGRVLRGMGVDPAPVEDLVARLAFPAPLAPVFDAAVTEASRLGDHYTGTDHLLWAITQDAAVMETLRYLGLDPAQVQGHLRQPPAEQLFYS
jgi:ATP-dependent Clp protease ATP-binding subunit ClpC